MMSDVELEGIKTVFRRFDRNGDGVIDKSELKGVLQKLDDTVWTEALVDAFLSVVDTSGDGLVQYEELCDWISSCAEDGSDVRKEFNAFYPKLREEDKEEGSDSSDSEDEEEEAAVAKPAAKSGAKKKGKSAAGKSKKKAADAATVKCEKTLEFGKPIRSAICKGRQVWTVDWQGQVIIRDRDDCTKVLGEIPTERFVWSMLFMRPGVMWMGQEAMGIALFDTKKKEYKETLRGGHTGGILCMAMDDTLGDEQEGFPVRKAWSGSNDFTIREWWTYTWRSKGKAAPPPEVSEDKEAVVLDMGKWRLGICKGRHLHGHKNGVKALLKLGPILWSGSDDATIKLWRCVDGECIETVEDAHSGGVNRLAVVKANVWSAGADGTVKEWNMDGPARQCLRQMSPPGSDKGIYALLPLGTDVWVAGHHPSIQVFAQRDMQQIAEEEGHKPYVSNLMGIDRIETKVVWSTSFGDRKLKVWRHTTRGEVPSVDELKAANILYQQEEENSAVRIGEYLKKIDLLENASEEHQGIVDKLNEELVESRGRCDALEAELAGIKGVFEEAGVGHLMSDLEALKVFTNRAVSMEELLKSIGMEHLLDDPKELGRLLQTMQQLGEILERCGFKSVLDNPSELEGILNRYTSMKEAFEKHGFQELFEDPQKLDTFLQNHSQVREVFRDAGLEHLLDNAEAARDFLNQQKSDAAELLKLREELARLEDVEKQLAERDAELSECKAALESALADVSSLTAGLNEQRERSESLQKEVDGLKQELSDASNPLEQLALLKKIFEEVGMGDLLTDMTALKEFLERAKQLEQALRDSGLEDLLNDPEGLRKQLQLMQQLKDILNRCGFADAWDDPTLLERVLNHYNAMKKVFEEHGFSELFEDVENLGKFLQTHSQVRAEFRDAGLERLLDSAEAARDFLQKWEQSQYDRQKLERLRQVFEEAGQGKLLEEYEAVSTVDPGEEEEDDFVEDEEEDEEEEEGEDDGEEGEEGDEGDEDEEGEEGDGDAEEKRVKPAAAEKKDAGAKKEVKKASASSPKLQRVKSGPTAPSYVALRSYLNRNSAFEKVLRDVGMPELIDDPPELGRLLRMLKELRAVLASYGHSDVEKDTSKLAEILSRYNALMEAFKENGFEEHFEDPEYTLKAFLRNHNRIREEFDKYGLGYLFDSVPAMKNFLAKWKDMEQELKAMKDARAGEKLAQRDAEMARLDARMAKLEKDIEDLQARLRAYEELGDIETVKKWKSDSEELKRLQRLYNTLHGRISDLERELAEKEKEREDALARERMMSVKYKELDIFKLDVIARELKALDGELGRLGSEVKALQNSARKLKNYDEQQGIGQQGEQMLDQCKLLRAHIRDVIHKCLSETQKMHIGVAIDDPSAAGELQDGGSMVAMVYEEIERPDHGHSKAAKLRQSDEVHGGRHR